MLMNIGKPGTAQFDFSSDLMNIAEAKFRATLQEDACGWIAALYSEYKAAPESTDQRKWITERLKTAFKSMDKSPAWVDMDNSHWPCHKNQPMVFLTQFKMKAKPETKDLVDDGSTVYVFGIADTGEYGEVKMVYREVTIYAVG